VKAGKWARRIGEEEERLSAGAQEQGLPASGSELGGRVLVRLASERKEAKKRSSDGASLPGRAGRASRAAQEGRARSENLYFLLCTSASRSGRRCRERSVARVYRDRLELRELAARSSRTVSRPVRASKGREGAQEGS